VGRSRKDSRRRITIDGVVYRYTVRGDDGFIALIARPEDARGQRLWVTFGYHEDWVPVGAGVHGSAGHRLILPRVVRLAILDGLRRGWNPAATKPGLFRVFDGDSLLQPDEAAVRPSGSRSRGRRAKARRTRRCSRRRGHYVVPGSKLTLSWSSSAAGALP
jgi:hypothetical protein